MTRRNAISVARGQTAHAASAEAATTSSKDTVVVDSTFVSSPAKSSQFLESGDAIMVDAEAVPASSPVWQTNGLASSEPAQASGTLMAPLESKIAGAQSVEDEDNVSMMPKEKGKGRETGNGKSKAAGSTIWFPNLSRSGLAELMQPEDLSRYVVDAPPLPGQSNAPESSSSRDKGKGKAPDARSLLSTHQIEALTTPSTKKAPNTYTTKKIQSSVERRFANYGVTHPPGWFDDLPPINEDLFKDSPHREYRMVLIHTARCNVCIQYNKGTLFMCADCTVSICEGCADSKCGVAIADAANAAAGKDDVVMADAGEEERGAENFVGREIVAGDAGEAGGGTERKLNWCGPYHEVFRAAYLEWKAEGVKDCGFTSTVGVEFKLSAGKQGGRKRKATG
jgi:hypothetical protein